MKFEEGDRLFGPGDGEVTLAQLGVLDSLLPEHVRLLLPIADLARERQRLFKEGEGPSEVAEVPAAIPRRSSATFSAKRSPIERA